MLEIKNCQDGIIIECKVQPNSSQNCIKIINNKLKVYLNAPAIDNKANIALVNFISKKWSLKKTDIVIIKGQTSKQKTILLKYINKIDLKNIEKI